MKLRALAMLLVLFATDCFVALAAPVTTTIGEALNGTGNDSNLDGTWDTFGAGPSIAILAYNGTNTYNYRGVLEFNVSSLPAPITVHDATLMVAYEGAAGWPALTLQFYSYAGNGVVELADFQTGASTPIGPRFNSFGPGGSEPYYYKVPVTSFIQSLANSGGDWAGFMVENLVNNQTQLGGYYSLNPPLLKVTYSVVPEPAAGALIVSALVGVGALVRRRRTSAA